MIYTIGLITSAIGALILVISIIINSKQNLKNVRQEFHLLTEAGYVSKHNSILNGNSVYNQEIINAPSKRRTVSKEAREIMERAEANITPKETPYISSEDKDATDILPEDATDVLTEGSTDVLSEDATDILDDAEGTAVLEQTANLEDTAVLDEREVNIEEYI